MASRSSSVIDIKEVARVAPRVATVPVVQAANTEDEGKALFSIGEVLRKVSMRVEDRLDKQAQVEAAKQGTLAGMGETLPALQDESTIRGEAFNAAAREAAITRLDLQGRLKLTELEDKYQADPAGFKKASEAYLRGATVGLAAFDQGLSQRYEASYKLREDGAAQRITERHQAVVRDQMTENALRLQMAATDEIAQQSQALFTSGPENVQKNLAQITSSAARIVDMANQVGPDGRPLFSARERLSFERGAEEAVAKNVAMAWVAKQPDILTAWQTWSKGEAKIAVAAGGQQVEMPLKEVLGEANYRRAQEAFTDQLKSQLALDSQVDAARDRKFKDVSDTTFSNLSVAAQDGRLDMATVEAHRSQLEPDRYLALRTVAKSGGATVSDGITLNRLTVADINGRDISGDLAAEYNAGMLSRPDYLSLYERNSSRLRKGQNDPVSQGRDFVGGSLGKLATDIGFAQAVNIPRAEAEYAVKIEEFTKTNGRQPTTTEALDIGQRVVDRYATIDVDTLISSIPKPMFMPAAQKVRGDLSDAQIQDVLKKTREHFINKHGGKVDQAEADPEYREEISNLKKLSDAVAARNAGKVTKQ